MLDFLGIGAQKAGTTWLYAQLSRHPEVRFPAGKEVHFWDLYQGQGLDWYRSLFAREIPGMIQGEITPAYGILSPSVIGEIHHAFPSLKLIYLVRDPIERAWSAALMNVKRAEMKPEEASDQWFIDHFRSEGSRKRGDYLACIANWQVHYPEQQLLTLCFEDIAQTPHALLTRAATHLGIDPGFFRDQQTSLLIEKFHASEKIPLRQTLKPILLDLYAPLMHKLHETLGIDYLLRHKDHASA